MMRLAFLTDLHIGRADADTYGVDVRTNFRNALAAVRAWAPDALILGGDLCFREPEAEIYAWIRQQLAAAGCPVFAVAGNHDDAPLMMRSLGLPSERREELFFRSDFGSWPALFLDTSKASCSEEQYVWLESQLQAIEEGIVFLHHPPFAAGVPYMDSRHAFREQRLRALLESHPHRLHLFCGHYHVALSLHYKNLSVHLTPSLFFQISRASADFAVDHYRIGYRLIELEGSVLRHELRYLDGVRLMREDKA